MYLLLKAYTISFHVTICLPVSEIYIVIVISGKW